MSNPDRSIVRGYGALTEGGAQDRVNEDAVLAVPEHRLFGIADGFGGSGAGDAAAKSCLADVREFVENGLGDSEVTLPFVYRSDYAAGANLVFNAFLHANHRLHAANKERPLNARAGASALFALFTGRHVTLANAGACGAFLARKGRAIELVKPRTYNAYRAATHWNPQWAFPMTALGLGSDVEPEIFELRIEPGDVVVMATDGVYPYLGPEDFAGLQTLSESGHLEMDIKQENQILIVNSKESGGMDDRTVITLVCG